MSYILDALKKSDSERQQRRGPTLATVQQPHFFSQGRSRSSVPLLLGCTFAVLLAVAFGGYRMGYLKFQLPAAGSHPKLSEDQQADVVQAGVAAEPKLLAANSSGNARVESAAPELPAEPARSDALDSLSVPASQEIPELWQLPASLREGIPQLDFSLHVYSTQIDQRSIIINNRMMREGESVTPQLTLSAITPDGVVMRYRSAYFRVGIVDGW